MVQVAFFMSLITLCVFLGVMVLEPKKVQHGANGSGRQISHQGPHKQIRGQKHRKKHRHLVLPERRIFPHPGQAGGAGNHGICRKNGEAEAGQPAAAEVFLHVKLPDCKSDQPCSNPCILEKRIHIQLLDPPVFHVNHAGRKGCQYCFGL